MVLRTFLLVLLFVFLARFVWRLLSGVIEGAMGPAPSQSGRRATNPPVKMVRDPVCGTYVVPGKALEMVRGRETLFFCSEKCRNQFLTQG